MAPGPYRAWERSIYQVSRSLYRRLGPYVADQGNRELSERNRRLVLGACEETMRRLAAEPDFARPARYLFEEIRGCFPMGEQLWVRRIVDFHITVAQALVESMPPPEGRECAAFTRRGTPCQREPVPGSDYCPSHRHLEEPADAPARL